MDNLLDRWENQNNGNHSKNRHKQGKSFSLFVIYVGGMLGNESLDVLANLSRLMEAKNG